MPFSTSAPVQEVLPPFAVMVPHGIHTKAATAAMAMRRFGGEGEGASIHLPKSFHARKASTRPRNGYDSDSGSELGEQEWDCFYELDLANLRNDSESIGFRIGTGTSELEDRGVDILTSYPGEKSYNVSGVHCELLLSSSGVWQIKSTSETRTTRVGHKYDFVNLGNGETYVPRFKTNRLKIGKWEADIIFTTYSTREYAIYRERLHRILEWNGRLIPDPRIWVLPTYRDFQAIGPAIVEGSVQGVANGIIRVGVHLYTGQALRVTSIFIKSLKSWSTINPHMTAMLSFKGAQGLMQAIEIRCDHGHLLNHELFAELLAEQEYQLQPLCSKDSNMVHIISELPSSNFRDFDWVQQSLSTKLTRLREVFMGIKKLHEKDITHGNISEDTVVLISENPPRAAVGGLGELRDIESATDAEGTQCITPQHSKLKDIQDLARVALKVLLPTGDDDATDSALTKKEIWHELTTSFLEVMKFEGRVEARVALLLKDMLSEDATLRPTAAVALAALPEYDWTLNQYKKLSVYVSPSKDTQKRIRDTQDNGTADGGTHKDPTFSPPVQKKVKHLVYPEGVTSSLDIFEDHTLKVQATFLRMTEMMAIRRELNIALREGVTMDDLRNYGYRDDVDTFTCLEQSASHVEGFNITFRTTPAEMENCTALSSGKLLDAVNDRKNGATTKHGNCMNNANRIVDADYATDQDRDIEDVSDASTDQINDCTNDCDAYADEKDAIHGSSSNSFGDEEDFTQEFDRVNGDMRTASQTQSTITSTTIFTQIQETADLSAPSSCSQEDQAHHGEQRYYSSESSEEE